MTRATPPLGLRENAPQFALLVLVNGLVGAMVGLERTLLPALAEQDFELAARTAVLSFIAVFGGTKAATNYLAGRWSDRWGRKPLLVGGWLVALPVPLLLMWAPSWGWILVANAFLGVSQGLTWSTTVIMKIDLAGPARRGLAMGINEFAGYLAVALSALATGYVASRTGLRPEPFALGIVYAVLGTGLSLFLVRETRDHARHEAAEHVPSTASAATVFAITTWRSPTLSAATQAGLVNNLNDGMAWGLFPLLFAAHGLGLGRIGWLVALYPAVWGLGQLITGAASDRWGRKPFIVAGMGLQAAGIGVVASASAFGGFATGSVLLGAGTALVYPTLLAAVSDAAHPDWRASAVGVYRLWRDAGYVVGALFAGLIADAFGLPAALWAVAALTACSGVVVWARMPAVPSTHATFP